MIYQTIDANMLVFVVFPLWWFQKMVEPSMFHHYNMAGCKGNALICLSSIPMSMSILSMSRWVHYIYIAYRIRLRILAFICWKSNLFDHLEIHLVMNFWNHKSNTKCKRTQTRGYDRIEHVRRRNTNKNAHTQRKVCGSKLLTFWLNILSVLCRYQV